MRALFSLAVLGAALALAPEARAQDEGPRLVLTAVDDSTGGRIVGASVAVVSAGVSGETDRLGIARVPVPAGPHVVRVEKEGYAPVAFTVTIGDEDVVGEVGMVPVVVLPVVTATAERARRDLERSGFLERREEGRGSFIDYEELVLRDQQDLATTLRGVPGVRLQRWDSRVVAVSTRNGIGKETLRSARPCPFTVYKDGIVVGRDETYDLSTVTTVDLAGIEVYSGPASIPPQYRQFNPCGVLLLWSRLE